MISASDYSAFKLVFASNPVGLYALDGRCEDFLFARETSVSGQCSQQWELRMIAQAAVLTKVAIRQLRSHLARSVKIGDNGKIEPLIRPA